MNYSTLERFTAAVLHRLASDSEWDADTIDTIAAIAIELGLATTDEHGFFRASEIIEPPARQR